MSWLYVLVALIGGAALSVQAPINAVLARGAESVLWAGVVSYAVGLGCVVALTLAARVPWPAATISLVPWWAWTGGLFGAVYVVTAIIAVPRLGAAALVAVVITSQLVATLLLDHFGLLGLPEHGINLWRLLGAAFLVCGVLLIRNF